MIGRAIYDPTVWLTVRHCAYLDWRVLISSGRYSHVHWAMGSKQTPARDPHRYGCTPGLVLGYDLFARYRDWPLVSPVSDFGFVQPQDRGLRGACQ